ncbi:RHS repeat protein [Rothia mucilaginosa]|uniref:RHS repeat protein n=1 Tax=Rothia mucilaginosa TaxID=43675 RepID=UPI0020A488D8|nr:hypothetical protein [Rothia mucilaginosa]
MRTLLIIFWGVDAFGAPVVTVESYDRLGRLVRQRREFGAQIPESFRTAYMDETGGYELSYAYDADGLRTEFVHPLGSSAYAYDAAGRMVKQTDITAYRLDGTAVTSEARVESSFEYNAVDALVRAQVSDLAGTWVREFGYRGAHMISVTEQPAEADSAVADSSEALRTEIIRDDLGRISGVDSPAGLVMYTYTDAQMLSSAVRGTETLRWAYDAAGALVRVEYFDSAQPQNAWVKVLVTDEGARVRAVCVYAVQDEAKADSRSAEFASAVEDAQVWLPQCPESVELEGVTLVPVSTSVFSYDGNDSRLLQVSSDGSGSSLTYGAAGFVNSVASWGSADDSAVSFSLLCASTDGRVLAAGGAPTGAPEFGVPSTGAGVGSVAGFDASVMHPLVWDENSFVPRVLGVGGSSMPSVGSLVPGAGSGAGLLDPYGWASLGVVAPAVPSAQGASATGGAPVLPDSLVGVSAASGVVLGSTGFEVLGARVVDSRVARFTAPDPLAAPVGAGWGADPFSLVGGNPVSLVDPWGLSPISFEEYEEYRQERIKNKGAIMAARWLQVAAVAVVVASVFWGGPLIAAIAWGAAAGALEGAAGALEKTKNGQVDVWNVIGEAIWGGVKGAVTGVVAKVFTHAQVFAKIPVNGFTENMASKMASKAGSSKFVPSVIQKPAQKAASFISTRRDSVSKLSWKTTDPAPWVRMQNIAGKYAPDFAGESLSAGVGAVWDYTKKAENFKAEDAAASFLSGATTGFYKSLITAPVKGKYSAKSEGGQYLYGPVKRTVANDMASRAANASVDWIDKGVQRRLLNDSARNPKPVSDRQAERLLAKDFQDAVMGNSKSNFKSLASGYKARRDGANPQSTSAVTQVSDTSDSDSESSE